MSNTNDVELKRAALLIAKLLLRTREGKIHWTYEGSLLGSLIDNNTSISSTSLDDGLEAILTADRKQLGFVLSGATINSLFPEPPLDLEVKIEAILRSQNPVLSITLEHFYRNDESLSPESVVYRNLQELIYLAAHPKSVSDDLRYKQAMSYLDKLTA